MLRCSLIGLIMAACPWFTMAADTDACADKTVGNKDKTWHDDGGAKYHCGWYASAKNRCKKFGAKHPWKGLTANMACCECDGGDRTGPTERKEVCEDLSLSDGSEWHDEGGASTNCAWYAEKSNRCEKYGQRFPFESLVANEACCSCEGGVKMMQGGEEEEEATSAEMFTVNAFLRLGNITVKEIGPQRMVFLARTIAKVLSLPEKRVQISVARDFKIPQREEKVEHNPFLNRKGSTNTMTRNNRLAFSFTQRKRIEDAVDLELQVTLSEVNAFELNLKKTVGKKYMRQQIRRQLKQVTFVSIPQRLSGQACLGLCNTATPTREGDMDECFCGKDCLTMNDCCPSFFVLPCIEEEKLTFAPTPRGPGDHWLAENQKWNMLDPNQGQWTAAMDRPWTASYKGR